MKITKEMTEEINVIRAKLWADVYLMVLKNDLDYLYKAKLPDSEIADKVLEKFDERFNDDKR